MKTRTALLLTSFLVWGAFVTVALSQLLKDVPLPPVKDTRIGAIFSPPESPSPRIEVRATGYCPCAICCGKWAGSPTASGLWPEEGRTLAADTTLFPYGTCLTLPDLGPRMVEDTGSAIKLFRIDVFFKDHATAVLFGVRDILVALDCERG